MPTGDASKAKSLYTQEIGDFICDHIADGGSPRTAAMAVNDRFTIRIQQSTIRSWREVYPLFNSKYLIARSDRGDATFERVGDVINQVLNSELDPQSAGVAIGGLKWMAAKDNDRYSDKVAFDVKHNLGALTDREMAERLLEAVPFLALACVQVNADDEEDEQHQQLSDGSASPL